MKNMLYVINGRFERNEFPLEGDVVLVGRSPENHIRLNDPSVSRAHLKIVRRGETFHIEDLNSRNGTWINGMPVKSGAEVPVTTGQHISLGNILVTIGRIFESEGLTSQYMIDLAGTEEDTEGFLFLKDRRITDRGHLETIYEISTLLMRSVDLPSLLNRISGAVFSSLESIDTMALLLMDEESGELNQVASRSAYPEGDPRAECSLTIVRRTVEEGKAVIMADTKQEEEGDVSASMTFKRIKSVMCVPLVQKSRIMGAVYVHSVDRPFGFRRSDLYLLTAVCGSASVAIENALLFKRQQEAETELRKARDELELRVQERTRELSVANTRLKEEIEERKRTEAALTTSEETLRDLFDNANDLIHSVSPEGRFLFVNRVWLETLGYTREELDDLSIFDIIAPESRDHCREAFELVITGESLTQLDAVFVTRQGRRINVEGNVGCRFEQGRPISTRAIFRDVTKRKAAEAARKEIEERFRNLASAAKDAIISIDGEGLINYWNRAAEAMFGYRAEDVLGRDPHPLLSPDQYRSEYSAAIKRWRECGKGPMLGKTRELTARRADGTAFPIELSLSSGKVGGTWNALGIVRDITERKEAEAVLQKRTQELDMRYKQVYCLYGISRLKGSPGANLNAVLQGIVDLIPGALQYPDIACARLSLDHDVYRSPGFRETEWTLRRTIRANRESTGNLEIFYTEERPDQDEGPFFVEERTLLHVIAEQVGEIIELKQAEEDLSTAREREIETAAKIQQTLLLGLPPRNLSGIRVAAMSVPSKRIDGDFYEFITLSSRVLDLIVGDVMGKGVPAALLGAGIKGHFLKALSAMLSPSSRTPLPGDIVQSVHNRMVGELIELDTFVTLVYARFDIDAKRVEFVDCGHPKALHVHAATGEMTSLKGHNVPLGFRATETYRQAQVPFEHGDLFFFYSDGVTEARDQKGRFFGEKRLSNCIRKAAHLSVEEIIERVREAVMVFSRTRFFSDDLTCVAVKVGGGCDGDPLSRMEAEFGGRLEELEALRLFVRRASTASGLETTDEDTQWQIGIALNEAFTNIVKHAYEGNPEGRIRAVAEIFPDEWVFSLHHTGKPFERLDEPAPPLDLGRENGFGLIIMDNYMDGITYSRNPDGTNTVRLVKKRR